MHPQPRTSVAGRYRLDRLLVDVTHVSLWRGHDEVLDRPVAVRIVEDAHPRTAEVLAAARSTACVEDRRIARVLDADELDGGIYVVTAWAEGRDLSDLLREGPLDAADAVALVGEIADVVTAAHAQGIRHGALDPTNVVVSREDPRGVTVLGLAVDAVLWDTTAGEDDDAALDPDVRGLGALLYACLTARWPLSDTHGEDDDAAMTAGIPLAPVMGARRAAPRQVRAAVPSATDAVCCRALGDAAAGARFAEPADLAAALAALQAEPLRGRWRPSNWLGRTAHRTAAR